MAFKASLTGNLGRKPEAKYLESGQVVSEISVAVRQSRKDAEAFWVKVELWGKQAEYAANYLDKGDTVFVHGDVKHEVYTKRDQTTAYRICVASAIIEKVSRRDEQAAPAVVPVAQAQPAPVSAVAAQQQLANAFAGQVVPSSEEVPF